MNRDALADVPQFVDVSLLSRSVFSVGAFCSSRGVRGFLVGGAVRDALLGRDTKDIDVAVEMSPRGLLELAQDLADALEGRYVLLHDEIGVARVLLPDSETIDVVAAPDGVTRDLTRRDFTVNAMALPLDAILSADAQVEVIDRHNGRADLASGVLRAVSPSVLDDDPVRLIRAPRLAAELGFVVSDECGNDIRQRAKMLERSSSERVREEFLKLLAAPGAMKSVRTLDDLGLLSALIPELDEAREVTQPKEHYWDVFNHCVETVGRVEDILGSRQEGDDWYLSVVPSFSNMDSYFGEPISDGHTRSTLVRLSGLLHDIAKPTTKTIEESGRIRFLGHHKEGAKVVSKIADRLRFGTRGRLFVERMVHHHLRPKQIGGPGSMPTRRAIFRYYRDLGDAAISTIYLNMADYLAARGPLLEPEEWREHCNLMEYILTANFDKPSTPRLISGVDVMDEFAVGPGPLIGTLLGAVNEAQAAGEIETKDDAMRLVSRMLEAGSSKRYAR